MDTYVEQPLENGEIRFNVFCVDCGRYPHPAAGKYHRRGCPKGQNPRRAVKHVSLFTNFLESKERE